MTAPSFWRRVRNTMFNPRRNRIAAVDMLDDGFRLTLRRRESQMRWADVTRIDAGSRDYFSHDALYVVMFAGNRQIEVHELDDGFRQFEFTLLQRWPQIRERWNDLLQVTLHEPQHETLWQRDA